MASAGGNERLKHAILDSIQQGSYPESEDVASAELPSSILPGLLSDLQQARDGVKDEIRQLSKDAASDVDGWIAQAKQLQADIERSRATAREIVKQAEEGKSLKARADDASNKVNLLEKELAFNESLADTLGHIKSASVLLQETQQSIVDGKLQQALESLRRIGDSIEALQSVENTRAYGILQDKYQSVKAALVERTTGFAQELVKMNGYKRCLRILTTVPEAPEVDMNVVVEVLAALDALVPYVQSLKKRINTAILEPCMGNDKPRSSGAIRTSSDTVEVSDEGKDSTVDKILDNFGIAFEFLGHKLPSKLVIPLSDALIPTFTEHLIAKRLDSTVPVNVEAMPDFQKTLEGVNRLTERVRAAGWSGTGPLEEWVQHAPRTWLSKRREVALSSVREILFTTLRERKTVERVETQTVSKGDVMMGGDQGDDDWGAWDEEEQQEDEEAPAQAQPEASADDEDSSAWDVDEEESKPEERSEAGEEDADAWGWGDEEDAGQKAPAQADHQKSEPPRVNGSSPKKAAASREVTLKETYTVTAVPDGIMDIIALVLSDAETLSQPNYSKSPVAGVASALYTLPTFALAMYRATASTAYANIDTGNMLIYNDASRLADRLRSFLIGQAEKDASSTLAPQLRPSSRLRLDKDIAALETFAKRAYSSEMESQRTILRDLLDGAQGFTNCTVPPYASECDSAIELTVDRLRTVCRQFETILSRSALLQSIGSLLNTVTSKIILDIEDISDIGEEESKRLRSYCDKVSGLHDLFIQQSPSGEKSDMTGIYCPNWFKFQYLAEVLESSLADIKYLWTDGELSLEFEKSEIVDLIEALFADSDYRRRAINDIKRSRG